MEKLILKPNMTKQEYIDYYKSIDSKLVEMCDVIPCECIGDPSCTGWRFDFIPPD
jgi:hypothetical protein